MRVAALVVGLVFIFAGFAVNSSWSALTGCLLIGLATMLQAAREE